MMKDLLEEMVRLARSHLPAGVDLDTWLGDPHFATEVDDPPSPRTDSLDFCMGYLRGAAEMADLTILELLDQYDVPV